MKFSKILSRKGMLFIALFSLLIFIGGKINFSRVIGAENQYFTLFQFFGPVAGYFLGPAVGVAAVLIAEIFSFIASGSSLTLVSFLRLLPMLFAAWYFGSKKDKASVIVPLLAIIIFIAHPVGRQVWYFSLFWTIPIFIKLLPKKYSNKAFLKSLGATFTAHSVGGALWNYAVPMTPEIWISLIPIVIFERLLFACGIAVSFVAINNLLSRIDAKFRHGFINIDRRCLLSRLVARH